MTGLLYLCSGVFSREVETTWREKYARIKNLALAELEAAARFFAAELLTLNGT